MLNWIRWRQPPPEQGGRRCGRVILMIAACLLLIIAGHTGCAGGQPAGGTSQYRSVLLISIDTLRADHLSCYGYPMETSPRLDRFLARGTIFRYAHATSSRTAPSHVSMMTGLYPSFTTVDVENGMYPLNSEATTLAECARVAGLRTAALVSNPVLSRRLNLNQGFEIYDDRFPRAVAGRGQRERIAADTINEALALLQDLRGEQFFIWVHIQDPHGPYSAPGGDRREPAREGKDGSGTVLPPGEGHSGYRSIPRYQLIGSELRLAEYVRRYDEEIRYFDRELGRLFDYLIETGLIESTLVAFTADHGEAFGEDDFYCAHGHGSGLDQARVPLGFVGPGVARGTTLDTAVSNIDIYSTLLEALGLDAPKRNQSRSLLDAIRSGREPEPLVGFTESATQRAAFAGSLYLRRDRYPLEDHTFWRAANPYTGAPNIPLGEIRSLAFGDAPGEELGFSDAEAMPPALRELAGELDRFSSEADRSSAELMASRRNRFAEPMDRTEEEQLRALGYLE